MRSMSQLAVEREKHEAEMQKRITELETQLEQAREVILNLSGAIESTGSRADARRRGR